MKVSRRNFLHSLGAAVATFAILPSASTYTRNWKRTDSGLYILNPEYLNAPYEVSFIVGANVVPIVWQRCLGEHQLPNIAGTVIREKYPKRFKSMDDFHAGKSIPIMRPA